ncbi:MAG: hypothetical protein LLF75_12005 [Eubacteriales bacterium]|nr:hypothetical protein [Eubacteriales bacterium]
MEIHFEYLREYESLLQSTPLQRDYQEFLRFFKYLRADLEQAFPSCAFLGGAVENGMDYSYFQFTDDALRTHGLKIVIAYVHKACSLEIWLSGVNRKTQADVFSRLQKTGTDYEQTPDPNRFDYILKAKLLPEGGFSGGDSLFGEIRVNVRRFLEDVTVLCAG